MQYPHVWQKVTDTPWLILPAKLNEIMAFVEAKVYARDAHLAIPAPPQKRFDEPYAVVDGVAVIPVYGTIMQRAGGLAAMSGAAGLQKLQMQLARAGADRSVHSILLDIDSPGGMADGLPEMADLIFQARREKPIHAIANTLAASAAYWLASQAATLAVTPSGMVGSIGVFAIHTDESGAWEKLGVRRTFIYAGERKIDGNRYEPLSDEARADKQAEIDSWYEDFLAAVGRGRGVSAEQVRANYGDGRLFRARPALELGMVDRIETLDQAIERLASANQPRQQPVTIASATAAHSADGNHTFTPLGSNSLPAAQATSLPWVITVSDSTSDPTDSLRPQAGGEHHGGDDVADKPETTAAEPTDVQAGGSDIEDLRAEIERVRAERDAALQASEAKDEQIDALAGRVTGLEEESRRKRLTDLAMGRGGENDGLRFFGDVEHHVGLMMQMAETWGEDSPQLAAYIEHEQRVAAAMNESKAFESAGHGKNPSPSADATGRFMQAVADERRKAAEQGETLSEAEAIERVATTQPALYLAYSQANTQRV